MKVFVTGVCGQLGHDVMNEIHQRGYEGIGADETEEYYGVMDNSPAVTMPYITLDITDKEAVDKVLKEQKPDAVIHCQEWSPDDMGEDGEDIEKLKAVNTQAVKHMAEICKELDCKLVYLSTAAVFDGQGTEPWKPDQTEFHPINLYGQTKLDGENAIRDIMEKYFIVRTSWVFGAGGNNFANRVLSEGIMRTMVYMVTDQFGTPTYTADLARLLIDMIETEKYGVYHAANEGGYISSYEYATELFKQAGCRVKVVPMSTDKCWISSAPKPYNSRLDTENLKEAGFEPLPDWKEGIARYMVDLEK